MSVAFASNFSRTNVSLLLASNWPFFFKLTFSATPITDEDAKLGEDMDTSSATVTIESGRRHHRQKSPDEQSRASTNNEHRRRRHSSPSNNWIFLCSCKIVLRYPSWKKKSANQRKNSVRWMIFFHLIEQIGVDIFVRRFGPDEVQMVVIGDVLLVDETFDRIEDVRHVDRIREPIFTGPKHCRGNFHRADRINGRRRLVVVQTVLVRRAVIVSTEDVRLNALSKMNHVLHRRARRFVSDINRNARLIHVLRFWSTADEQNVLTHFFIDHRFAARVSAEPFDDRWRRHEFVSTEEQMPKAFDVVDDAPVAKDIWSAKWCVRDERRVRVPPRNWRSERSCWADCRTQRSRSSCLESDRRNWFGCVSSTLECSWSSTADRRAPCHRNWNPKILRRDRDCISRGPERNDFHERCPTKHRNRHRPECNRDSDRESWSPRSCTSRADRVEEAPVDRLSLLNSGREECGTRRGCNRLSFGLCALPTDIRDFRWFGSNCDRNPDRILIPFVVKSALRRRLWPREIESAQLENNDERTRMVERRTPTWIHRFVTPKLRAKRSFSSVFHSKRSDITIR